MDPTYLFRVAVCAREAQRLGSVSQNIKAVGYANGNMGYLPSREAFDDSGYEVGEAGNLYGLFGVGPEAEETLLNGIKPWRAGT